MKRPARWVLWILIIATAANLVAGCASVAGEANGMAPSPFLDPWRACGGPGGAGGWLAGPFWFQGNLVGVATNMVFVWRADAPQGGAQPFSLYPPQPSAARREGFVYENGHNVVPEIAAWIRSHGGWRCAGPPVGEPFERNGQICQPFANMEICYNPARQEVSPQPVGRQFLQAKGKALEHDLSSTTLPGWQAQVTATLPDARRLQIEARVVSSSGAPWEALAVQIDDVHGSTVSPFYYNLVAEQTLPGGVWKATVPLPKLAPGKHTLAVKVCAVGAQGWLACAASSAMLKIPDTSK